MEIAAMAIMAATAARATFVLGVGLRIARTRSGRPSLMVSEVVMVDPFREEMDETILRAYISP